MDTLVKFATVFIFAALLYFLLDFIKTKFATELDMGAISPTMKYFLCKFGIWQALNIFVSLFVASWFTEKVMRYLG